MQLANNTLNKLFPKQGQCQKLPWKSKELATGYLQIKFKE